MSTFTITPARARFYRVPSSSETQDKKFEKDNGEYKFYSTIKNSLYWYRQDTNAPYEGQELTIAYDAEADHYYPAEWGSSVTQWSWYESIPFSDSNPPFRIGGLSSIQSGKQYCELHMDNNTWTIPSIVERVAEAVSGMTHQVITNVTLSYPATIAVGEKITVASVTKQTVTLGYDWIAYDNSWVATSAGATMDWYARVFFYYSYSTPFWAGMSLYAPRSTMQWNFSRDTQAYPAKPSTKPSSYYQNCFVF